MAEQTGKPFKRFKERIKEVMDKRPTGEEISRLNRVFEKDIEEEKRQEDEGQKRIARSHTSEAEI